MSKICSLNPLIVHSMVFNGTYYSEDELVPGTGYWLNFYADGSSVIQGEFFTELTIELSEGWKSNFRYFR